MISLLDEGQRVGLFFLRRQHFFVINREHSFMNSLLLNLTLCCFSMRLSCCVKSLNDGLASGSLCQQLTMTWYLEKCKVNILSVFQVHLNFSAAILFIPDYEERMIPILFKINFELKALPPWKKRGPCDTMKSKENKKVWLMLGSLPFYIRVISDQLFALHWKITYTSSKGITGFDCWLIKI